MSRRSAILDFSIRGDELEQNRIQLEHNLQHTDLSLHLSSIPDDDYSDVEYPRHNSAPSPFSAFASFEQRSGDHFDPSEHSQYHAWSYRTVDDEDGVNPYAGETISTAAHHASALTLSAGLGGRAARRDVSLSGAEYDPDRPLQGIMAGINGRFSELDIDSTKSRHITSKTINYDPLVVDDTAELDRVLQSGHASQLPPPICAPASYTSSSVSDSRPCSPVLNNMSPRPKLSDALNAVAFSPKRPRGAQSPNSPRSHSFARLTPSPSMRGSQELPVRPPSPAVFNQGDYSTPKPRNASRQRQLFSHGPLQQSLSYVAHDPEVNIQPPTPSIANSSKFTKVARGLARDIHMEQTRRESDDVGRNFSKPVLAQSTIRETRASKQGKERNPFQDIGNQIAMTADPIPTPARKIGFRTPFKGRLHLPDVTGLTSAVESPAKVGLEHYGYDAKDDGEVEARLFTTLNIVQSKLAFLESENSISRRRVRELELELEACKQEVARERTKVLDREEAVAQQRTDIACREKDRLAALRHEKGKAKAQRREAEVLARDQAAVAAESRYKQAVEEKKALEALISTLRAHLTRLTAELSDHQRLLSELRSLRDSDVHALAEKSKDVDNLRQEVERLAGEVEVLRGVVEEGLKERRGAREQLSLESSHISEDEHSEENAQFGEVDEAANREIDEREEQYSSESEDDNESTISSRLRSPTPSPRRHAGLADRTMRTDHATVGSSQLAEGMSTKPFVDASELERISAEVEERRLERSVSPSLSNSRSRGRSRSGSHSPLFSRTSTPE
ncbi:hypothetical protein AcW1_007340 [Taiwanofungus camphoratus]|nr:hypothetical protein AcW2_007589 [Antrodia cinnamomea]KAI0920046.1 hypothetical protein AcV7_006051 [Antrodia cinnamomea]KAI0927406.1 hypothetical protein AcV5_007953 [Antrodia cinnamomea]KAI0953012.1 hypothetical protein AcW1_007340 [Antrodia cinnamomea]